MSKSNIKQKPIDRDYFRRPGLYKNYDEMVRAIPFRATTDYYNSKHSEFEKPYLDDIYNYERMQHLWPKTFRIPYLNLRDYGGANDIYETGGGEDGPCLHAGTEFNGTANGEPIDGWIEVLCGTHINIGLQGGGGGTSAHILNGGGSIDDDDDGILSYFAPPCGCCEEGSDNILVSDVCGNYSNIIVKIICTEEAPLTIASDMVTDPASSSNGLLSNGDSFYAIGGSPPYLWSIDCGTLEVSGDTSSAIWTDDSCCGPGIITVEDACGNQASMNFRYPDVINGTWGSFYTYQSYCLSAGASWFELYSGSSKFRYHWATCGFSSCPGGWNSCAEAKSAACGYGACGPDLCGHPSLPGGTCFTLTSSCDDEPCDSANCFERCAWTKIIQRSDWECP